MSVTNAISSVIIVGALIATGAAGSKAASWFGFLAVILASVNIFGGFTVTQRMLGMYRKRDWGSRHEQRRRAGLSRGRGLLRPGAARPGVRRDDAQGNRIGIAGMVVAVLFRCSPAARGLGDPVVRGSSSAVQLGDHRAAVTA